MADDDRPSDVKGKGKAKAVDDDPSESSNGHGLLALPPELIECILKLLDAADLACVSATCRGMSTHARTNRLWQALVQENVPGQHITSSFPFATFHELYRAHDPRWFIPKYKIWFSDAELPGRLLVARYDQRRGCIEGYQLVATKRPVHPEVWQADNQTIISHFDPVVKLHLDIPIIRLPADPDNDPYLADMDSVIRFTLRGRGSPSSAAVDGPPEAADSSSTNLQQQMNAPSQSWQQDRSRSCFQHEIMMRLTSMGHLQNSFTHARYLPEDSLAERLANTSFPYGNVWPPPTIPSPQGRVAGTGLQDLSALRDEDIALSRGEVCDRAFRVRKWIEMHLLRGGQVQFGLASRRGPRPRASSDAGVGYVAGDAGDAGGDAGGDGGGDGDDGNGDGGDGDGDGGGEGEGGGSRAHETGELYLGPAVLTPAGGLLSRVGEGDDAFDHPVHLGEEISTYATLDPKLYTPTEDKPFRGIWVGDYATHGCEFLWLHQPDDDDDDAALDVRGGREGETVANSSSSLQRQRNRVQDDSSTDSEVNNGESASSSGRRRRGHRGRLMAIKLTGDANVPRGEYSFIVDDLGPGGFLRVAHEPPFDGVRVVRARGHLAHTGYSRDMYVDTQLMLISHDRLAHYWMALGHISYYHRVDIDQFLVPS